MARQKGQIKLEGTIGDMTFYKSKDGYIAKEKTSLNGDRIASDPNFERTRENMSEFGNAGLAGKLLRHSVNTLLKSAKDSKMISRLTRQMMDVLKSDTINKRGQRTVAAGDLSLLKGFEFNADGKFGSSVYTPYTTVVDRTAGTAGINIPAFTPTSAIIAPQGATHFRFVSAAAAIDFVKGTWESKTNASSVYPLDETPTGDISIVHTLTAGTSLPLFLVLGVQFLQEINGVQYPLLTGSFNALSLVEVSIP